MPSQDETELARADVAVFKIYLNVLGSERSAAAHGLGAFIERCMDLGLEAKWLIDIVCKIDSERQKRLESQF